MTATPKRPVPLAWLEHLARFAPSLEGKSVPFEPSPGGTPSNHGARPAHLDDSLLWRAALAQAHLERLGRVNPVAARVLRFVYVTTGPHVRELPAVYAAVLLLSRGQRMPEAPPHPGPRPKAKAKGYASWSACHARHRAWQGRVVGWAREGVEVLRLAREAWEEVP